MLTTCPACRRPLKPDQLKCKCGKLLLELAWQPKQWELLKLAWQVGPDVPTKLGFGGSRGSTKSRAGRDIALWFAVSLPNITIYIVTRNADKAEENYVSKYRVERPELMPFYRNQGGGRPAAFEFPKEFGGSRIVFRYADTLDDAISMGRGPEAYLVIIEQAEQFTEAELLEIVKPCRWPDSPAGACKVIFLFNPGGAGTDYLRRVFYLKQYKGTERPSDFAFLQAYGWDNYEWFKNECATLPAADWCKDCTCARVNASSKPHRCYCSCHAAPDAALTFEAFYQLPGDLPDPDPDGRRDQAWLDSLPDCHRLKIYCTRTTEGRKYWGMPDATKMGDLFGRFDQMAGQYFAGVWEERACVLSIAEVENIAQPWWTAWMGGDLGFGHHSAIFWACMGKLGPGDCYLKLGFHSDWPLDVVLIYREFVAHRLEETELARQIVSMTPKWEIPEIRRFVMGSDTKITDRWAPHSRRELIDGITVPAGLPAIRSAQDGPGSRVINARLMYSMLQRTVSYRSPNPPQDRPDEKLPPLLFVSADCPQLISAIPLLLANTEDGKPDDVVKMETVQDDIFDGVKYTCAEWLMVKTEAPREVRYRETLDRAETMQGRYIAALKFDAEERQSERRGRRH